MPQDCCIVSKASGRFRLRCIFMVSVVLSVVPCLVPITASQAQERIRSAARELEIQEFRKPETLIRLGPFQEELTGFTGIEFTDNSSIVQTGKISRVSIYEGFNLNTIWALSHINQLEFNLAGRLRETFYANGTTNVT